MLNQNYKNEDNEDIKHINLKELRKEVKQESSFDVNKLLKAIDNENNENILNLDLRKIKKIKNDALQQLQLTREQLKIYHNQLKNYRFVSDLSELKYGGYIRWFSLKNPENIRLSKGAIVSDIKMYDSGIVILLRTFGNRFFNIKFDECHIFQKITTEEYILLDIMEHLGGIDTIMNE